MLQNKGEYKMENLYEKIRRIVETEWKSRLVTSNLRKREWFYKDELERYLNLEHNIPVNKSSPVISKLKKAGVITYVDTRRGKIKCILGESTTKQGNIHSEESNYKVEPFKTNIKATIGFSRNIGISPDFQLMYELKRLYPEFDTDKVSKYSERKRDVEIKGSADEIVITIRRK